MSFYQFHPLMLEKCSKNNLHIHNAFNFRLLQTHLARHDDVYKLPVGPGSCCSLIGPHKDTCVPHIYVVSVA